MMPQQKFAHPFAVLQPVSTWLSCFCQILLEVTQKYCASKSHDKLFTWFSLLNTISWNIQWDETHDRLLHNQNLQQGFTTVSFRAQYRKINQPAFWLKWVLTYSRDGNKTAQKLNPLFYCCFHQGNRFNSITLLRLYINLFCYINQTVRWDLEGSRP